MRRKYQLIIAAMLLALASLPGNAELAGGLDFFIGKWDIATRYRLPDGIFVSGQARSEPRKILDGTAILDEWRSLDADGNVVFRGASFRTALPGENRWRIVWMMSNVDGYTELEGEFVDGEFHMQGTGEDPGGPFLERARYYNIHAVGFSFTMDRSYDGGKTWISPFSEFTATRLE